MAHPCPHWTGITTHLALGVGVGYVLRTWHVTFVRSGLRCSGKLLLRKDLMLKGNVHALQALFPLHRRLLLVRGLLRKSRTLRLSLLPPPFLQKGGFSWGGVSRCTWCCFPWGFLSSRSTCVRREGWKCFWTLVCCA